MMEFTGVVVVDRWWFKCGSFLFETEYTVVREGEVPKQATMCQNIPQIATNSQNIPKQAKTFCISDAPLTHP
jgi:hypothetical protein